MTPPRSIRSIKTIISDISDTEDIRLLSLRDPDGWELPPATPGSHIDLYLNSELTRAYSLCGDPENQNQYQVAVKKDAQGRGGSVYVHNELRPGDHIHVSLPRNTFPAIRVGQTYILVAGGIGVTPFIAMLYQFDRLGIPYQLHLFYRDTPPLINILAQLGRSGEIVLHNRAAECKTIQMLIPKPNKNTHAFCCGPLPMMGDFDHAVRGWNPANIGKEFFVPPELVPADSAYSLILKRSGQSVAVPVGTTALKALQQAGVAVQSSCEGGICGACKVEWLEGEPVHNDLCLSAVDRNTYFMPCVGSCKSDALVLNL